MPSATTTHSRLNLETILSGGTVNDTTRLATIGWWNLFMGLLQSPNSTLERLNLKGFGQGFDDSMIESLGNALAYNSRLRELSLHFIRHITPVGWQNFVDVLRNPNLALEKLYLNYNSINDHFIVIFVEALASNNTLKVFNFGDEDIDGGSHSGNINQISPVGFAPFAQILCDTSGIMNTYNSNHTLEKLCGKFRQKTLLSEDLITMLRINKENSVNQAALIKIIGTHFSGSNINTQIFSRMDLGVRPTAIAWMGWDDENSGISDVLSAFLRSQPLVCNTKGKSKKRKTVGWFPGQIIVHVNSLSNL